MRLLVLLISIISCSHKEREEYYLVTPANLQPNSCLKHLESSKRDSITQLYEVTKEGLGKGTSYLLTGFGYATEVTIYIVAGIGAGITICSPLILAEATVNGTGRVSGECVAKVGGEAVKSLPSNIGEDTYHATRLLRCPEVDYISSALRKVARCYRKKDQTKKYKEQVRALEKDSLLAKCSSKNERKKVHKML